MDSCFFIPLHNSEFAFFSPLYQLLKENGDSLSARWRAAFLVKPQLLLEANQQFCLQHF